MSAENLAGLIISAALFGYLIAALLRADKTS